MMRHFILFIIVVIALMGCIKPYTPNLHSPTTGYLVVEGNINSGAAPTVIHLSRTEALTDSSSEIFENNATLLVECSDGTTYPATAGANGTYTYNALPLDSNKTYRLDINTADGNKYQSDFVPVIANPPIDSVNAIYKNDGMHFYVNTHNSSSMLGYYQWTYTETWEYHSAEESFAEYDPADSQVVTRPPADDLFTCWNSDNSVSIIINSTAKLSSDEVYEQPLLTIPPGDQRLSVEYSVLVNQLALSMQAFNFLQLMQSNTENLGSIFDPLPSSLASNIHCLTNPSLMVVGYVNVSSQQQLRVFLPSPSNWSYSFECMMKDTLIPGSYAPSYVWAFTDVAPIPVPRVNGMPLKGPIGLYIPLATNLPGGGWFANLATCIDCRMQGGTTTEPSFWP